MTSKIRVLVIDDSAIVRKILADALSKEADIEVVGTAIDPLVAADKIAALRPDVLTLDLEMPRMDGISFLRKLMSSTPMPVIVISSLAKNNCRSALDAMEAGAVEVIPKPSGPYSVGDLAFQLAQKVRSAAHARLRACAANIVRVPESSSVLRTVAPPSHTSMRADRFLIAIGASTGGTEAVARVLREMPVDSPPIVIVQHIPPVFSAAFAERLDRICRIGVKEAADGDAVIPGRALIAPGDHHMLVRRSARGLTVQIKSGPRVCYQRPSVDVLFQSVADAAGPNGIGVILTGMGNDGAAGLLKMRNAGARTMAQDERTSVIYGMPKEALKNGAAEQVVPLHRVCEVICAAAEIRRHALNHISYSDADQRQGQADNHCNR
jgi:two-component system chemotaxis response regulator CheB